MDLKNIQYVYVASPIARQATTVTNKSAATYIADGEIVVTDLAGNVLTTTAATYTKEKVKIVYRKGGIVLSSPAISYKNVKNYLVKGYSAPIKQISYIGYNGTSGTFENNVLIPGTDYIVTLRKETVTGQGSSHYDNKSVQYYNETATSGQNVLADGLYEQLVTNFNNDHNIDNYVKFERISSATSSALGSTATLTVVENSKRVVASSSLHGLVVGDYVRIGHATTNTYPIYKVVGVNSTVIMLDVSYQGINATSVAAGKLASPTSANWGIRITANDHYFEPGRWKNDMFKFTVTLENFNNTLVTDLIAPYIGSGTYNDVAEKEWYAFGAEALGFAEYNIPPRVKSLKATSGITYNWIVISAVDNDYSNIHSRPESPFEILIAIPVSSSSNQGGAAGSSTVSTGVALALDNWLTTMTGSTVNQTSKLV